jgi:hypothetical protein
MRVRGPYRWEATGQVNWWEVRIHPTDLQDPAAAASHGRIRVRVCARGRAVCTRTVHTAYRWECEVLCPHRGQTVCHCGGGAVPVQLWLAFAPRDWRGGGGGGGRGAPACCCRRRLGEHEHREHRWPHHCAIWRRGCRLCRGNDVW